MCRCLSRARTADTGLQREEVRCSEPSSPRVRQGLQLQGCIPCTSSTRPGAPLKQPHDLVPAQPPSPEGSKAGPQAAHPPPHCTGWRESLAFSCEHEHNEHTTQGTSRTKEDVTPCKMAAPQGQPTAPPSESVSKGCWQPAGFDLSPSRAKGHPARPGTMPSTSLSSGGVLPGSSPCNLMPGRTPQRHPQTPDSRSY